MIMMRMLVFIVTLTVLALGGCATIIKGTGPQNIQITSNPSGAECKVSTPGLSGSVITKVQTPNQILLERGFGSTGYEILCTHSGKESQRAIISKQVSGWVLGNAIFAVWGAVIGFIVDQASGGAFVLVPEKVHVDFDNPDNSILRASDGAFVSDPLTEGQRAGRYTPEQKEQLEKVASEQNKFKLIGTIPASSSFKCISTGSYQPPADCK